MNTFMTRTAVLFAAALLALATTAPADTYTWLASPANATWDTSSLNWSDGTTDGVPWVNDSSTPHNATFGSSSKTTMSVGSTCYVNNLTIGGNSYTFNGSGPISVAGTVTLNAGGTFYPSLASGRPDGSLHFAGNDWQIGFLYGQNTQSSTYLEGNAFFAPNADNRFGVVPAEPTENIFINGAVTIFASGPMTVNKNRTMRIASGKSLKTGSNHSITFKNQIVADNTDGYDHSRNTYVQLRENWSGLVTFDPGEGRTNAFGRLQNNKSRLKIASGVTKLTGPQGTDVNANLYVQGNGSSFSDTKGNMLIDGGELYNPQSQYFYVDVRSYGQVTVTNGGTVFMPQAEWLNGLSSPGRLTVAKDGIFHVGWLRLSQSNDNASEILLEEGGLIKAGRLSMDTASKAVFTFNGGTFQSLADADGRALFVGTTSKWAKVTFNVGEKGAVFNADGQHIWWNRSLTSGVSGGNDGGIHKTGDKLLILQSENFYTGPTVVEGTGNLCPRVDNSLPAGTTIRISGGAALDFNSYETISPARDSTNWVGRLEGSANVNNCSALHVTNAIAPSIGGTFGFTHACDLRCDYEVSAQGSRSSCLYFTAEQDLSGMKLKLANPQAFDKNQTYRIVWTRNAYTGTFDESALPHGWKVVYEAKQVLLKFPKPFILIVR